MINPFSLLRDAFISIKMVAINTISLMCTFCFSDLSQGCNWWLLKRAGPWSHPVKPHHFLSIFCLFYEKNKAAFIQLPLFINFFLVPGLTFLLHFVCLLQISFLLHFLSFLVFHNTRVWISYLKCGPVYCDHSSYT